MILLAAVHKLHPLYAVLGLIVLGLLIYGGVQLFGRHQRPTEHDVGRPSTPPAHSPRADGAGELSDTVSTRSSSFVPPAAREPVAVAVSNGHAAIESPTPVLPKSLPAEGWAVEAHSLTKRFGSNIAVDGVDLFVPRGVAFGYLGPNGAGKTTLIRTLLGLTRADSGSMFLLGYPVPAERSRALARVGAIVDEPRFYGHLTGRENLSVLAAARAGGAFDRISPSLARVGLAQRADDRVATYSMGMRQRLGVAACLLADPELLLLDEPMNGLDPAGMHEIREMIRGLVGEGRTVVLSSHLLDEVERTCDAVAIVDRGRVIRQGSIAELVQGAGGMVLRIGSSDAMAAARVIGESGLSAQTTLTDDGLSVTLSQGATQQTVGDINRRLVENGISVYRIEPIRTSLEEWFLSVTSRFGGES